jgi:alkylresorcinol/alkylpyrone synthase
MRTAIYKVVNVLPKLNYCQKQVQHTVIDFIRTQHPDYKDVSWLEKVFNNSHIKQRGFVFPPSALLEPIPYHIAIQKTFEAAVGFIKHLNLQLFHQSRISTKQVAKVIIGSETSNGMSLDNYTHINSEFSPQLKRSMLVGMGCVGGVATLSQGHDYLQGHSSETIQTINVDIFSKLYLYGYQNAIAELKHKAESKTLLRNILVPAVLLGDAGASTLMIGEHHTEFETIIQQNQSLIIVNTHRVNIPNTTELVHFHWTPYGQLPLLKPGIPEVAGVYIEQCVNELLTKNNVAREDICFWIIHPGSFKVLQNIQIQLQLTDEEMSYSYWTWKNLGNCASPTVLMVLTKFLLTKQLHKKTPTNREYGIMVAIGPGISVEALLVQY